MLEALLALPAQSRARRELGALVTRTRAARTTSPRHNAPRGRTLRQDRSAISEPTRAAPARGDSLPPTRTLAQRAAAPPAASAGTTESEALVLPGRNRAPLIVLGAAIAFACVVLGIALLRPSQPDPLSRPKAAAAAPGASRAARPPAPPIPASGSTNASPAIDGPPSALSPAAPAPSSVIRGDAVIEVVMLPYGEIFIDGKRIGSAPITLAVAPGDHADRGQGP